MSTPCGHKKNTETVAQYRKRCGGRPLGMIQKVSESDVKTIHNILTQHGKSASKATSMIKKNYRKVAKQFRGDSLRDLAMALIGYDVIGENKELFKMYKQAMKMMPGSPKQKELIKKISSLRKKLKMDEAPRKPRKKGQHRNSPSHSDLYTDENPKGTIHGLKFATVKDAQKSVSKIKSSGKSHAHKIQAAVAMEQRAREMGKSSQAAVYRKFINSMKKKTKKKNEGWSNKYKKSIDCNNPKGFSQKAHCAGRKKQESKMSLKLEEVVGKSLTEEQFDEAAGEKDACYHKVKARYDVWPSAYASGALVKCRKVGAKNWGNKSKKEGLDDLKALPKDLKKSMKKKRNEGYSMRDLGLSPFFKKLNPDQRQAVSIALVMGGNMSGAIKAIEKIKKGLSKDKKVKNALRMANEGLGDKFGKTLDKYNKKRKKNMDALKKLKKKESVEEARGTCWVGYKQIGMKDKGGRKVPNCVKEIYYEENGKGYGYTFELPRIQEAEYQGRKVKLNKIMQGDKKKFKVYVKNPKGNVVVVHFGQGGDAKGGTMRIRKSNPEARKSFRARHNCDNPGPKHKARYWSCRKW